MSLELLLNLLGLSLQLFSPGGRNNRNVSSLHPEDEQERLPKTDKRFRHEIEDTELHYSMSQKLKERSHKKASNILTIVIMGALGFVGLSYLLRPEETLNASSQPTSGQAYSARAEIHPNKAPSDINTLETSSVLPRSTSTPVSCGDVWTKVNDTLMWPVYVNSRTLEDVQSSDCQDAFEVKRQDTGVIAVQVASFFNEERARKFAQQVGGDIGEPVHLKKDKPTAFCGDDLRQMQLTAFAVLVANDLEEIRKICLDAFESNNEVQMAIFATRERAQKFSADWGGRVVPKKVGLDSLD